jgi:nucleoside-diphosphate-sugar epimerase
VITSVITGGAGFLGSHLVDALVNRGENVVVIDNLSTGRLANVADAIESGQVTFIYADVAISTAALRDIFQRAGIAKIHAIYHLASPASPAAYQARPWETLAVNGLGTMSLIDVAIEHQARFIFSSSSEVYGDPLQHPQPETYFGNVDPVGPRSCYDEGKRFGEAAVAAAVRSRGLDARIVRFFNCYGPRMQNSDGRLIPSLLDAVLERRPFAIHGTGQQTRSMTYIADAIELLLLVAASKQTSLAPVNIGNDDERTVVDIARAVATALGVDYAAEFVAGREGDPQRRRPELTRARSLGWSPKTPLEQGLRSTHDWYAKESQIFV